MMQAIKVKSLIANERSNIKTIKKGVYYLAGISIGNEDLPVCAKKSGMLFKSGSYFSIIISYSSDK